MTLRVLVLGGRGYYGGFIVDALRTLDGVEVAIGGRAGPVVVDLGDPATFGAMRGFDAVVDAADTVGAAPDAAAIAAVKQGAVWLEASADRAVTERLLALDVEGPGALVVGVGIFPGMSTALAAVAAAGLDRVERVEASVRLSPFSGAGRGNCALMRRMLETPGARVVDGAQIETPALFAAERVVFPSGAHAAVGVGLPDVPLIHQTTGAAHVTSRMALAPGFLRFGFALSAALMRIAGPLRRPMGWMTELSLIVLRAGLLRGVSSRVELVAVAEGGGQRRVEQLDVADGQRGTADGVAAAVLRLRDGHRPPPGVYTAPEAFGGGGLLEAFRAVQRRG